MYWSYICKEQSRNWEKMLTTDQKHQQCNHPHKNSSKCMDTDFSTNNGINRYIGNLSWRSTKIHQTPIHILCIPPVCSTTSQHFHLLPHYETQELTTSISLSTVNLNLINISSPEFRIWQHLKDHWNGIQLHHLVNIPSVPVDQLYKHTVSRNKPVTPFMSTDESIDDVATIGTLFSHTAIYIRAIGSLILARLGIFCCYFFWCWPSRLVCQPSQSGSMWHTIVDDDVEAAPSTDVMARLDSL